MYRWLPLFALLLFLGPASSLRAVVVVGETHANCADPGNGVPWNRVGIIDYTATLDCTGVYLGTVGLSSWVLTAKHVGAKPFSFDGTTFYAAVAGSEVTFNTAGGTADLLLYRIDTAGSAVGGSLLDLSVSSLVAGSSVTMIGYSGGTMRWGTNTVETGPLLLSNKSGTEKTVGQYTDMDAGVTGEAQAAIGDSGGAVFSQNASEKWMLSGIMIGIDQEGEVRRTYFVDLSYYRSEIMVAIPEPSTCAVYSGFAALAWVLWMRRRRH